MLVVSLTIKNINKKRRKIPTAIGERLMKAAKGKISTGSTTRIMTTSS